MKPRIHQKVQARLIEQEEAVGWTVVPRGEAEQRRGIAAMANGEGRVTNASLFFDDLLDAKVREINPFYSEAQGTLHERFRHLHTDIYGNQEFSEDLRSQGKFIDHAEKCKRDLMQPLFRSLFHGLFTVRIKVD